MTGAGRQCSSVLSSVASSPVTTSSQLFAALLVLLMTNYRPQSHHHVSPGLTLLLSIYSHFTQVTTPTPRPSARLSTSAPLTELAASPSTASSAPTELSSTRTTSSATGGSTSTAPPPRTSTASTTRSPPRGTPWPAPPTRPSTAPRPSTRRPRPRWVTTLCPRRPGEAADWEVAAEAGAEVAEVAGAAGGDKCRA